MEGRIKMAKQDHTAEQESVLSALRATAATIDAGEAARRNRPALLQRGRDVGIHDDELAKAARIGRSSVRTLLTRSRASA